ncbi:MULTISPECIES: transcriptional regulator NrdR [unclassified Methylophaga]|jgi:transcriptional repressor NrdR|uniref:transcriptional regulator NrdR n=1 Tax=unclassified Methylophaga TaxID=2629249 RepID=UPI000C937CE6|nr:MULTISPECIES: transcriptional regulator NrdR [unclassified Methylophaga]MAK66601.1 transcriptional regulator NrdR [Methylophaga sp.]MAY17521.1 transcriptional regulator NrdR [Methylophaga sp.]MBN47463.1 transcriptional regulator NrdR [Methylophaga sp.]MDO8827885.1 transcriptional regulator NrdR [Methylophaga sp.]HAO24582.1 transcriptional regulator NrdR [Methylophaga sp.]|tara:strand:+ start:11750 stop:12223 length:474 start_codon:yes stop_codon:yes gene_type:complete
MRCPFCGAEDSKVVDSRLSSEGDAIRRRRMCQECNERFTTYETAELSLPRLIKRDATREAFDENKLRAGIMRALEKRPVSIDAIDNAVKAITRRLWATGEREVQSRLVGDWVMDALRELDEVAYVRFASVYRSFQDVNAFREEIERMENRALSDKDS